MKLAAKLFSTQWLQKRVADRYQVSPIDSIGAFEEFVDDDFVGAGDEVYRATNYTFRVGMLVDKHVTDIEQCRAQLAGALWYRLSKAWPVGTFVIWRLRPEFGEDPVTAKKRGITFPGILYVRCRLGAFIPPHSGSVEEGNCMPLLSRSRERKCRRKKK